MRIKLRRQATDDEGPHVESRPPGPLSVSGDLRIEGGAAFPSGLIVGGDLTLSEGAHVEGNVYAEGALRLGPGVKLDGDATVEGDAIVAVDARVMGHLVCRRLLLVAAPNRQVEPVATDEVEAAPVADVATGEPQAVEAQ